MNRRTGKGRKEQHRQRAMNQRCERRVERENLLRCRCFVVLFFFCWHSEHGGSRQRFFYRSHATSQWSMDAGPLQTYTVEHALCGSAKHGCFWVRRSTSRNSPRYHLSTPLFSHPSRHSLYFLLFTFPFFISATSTESLLKREKQRSTALSLFGLYLVN